MHEKPPVRFDPAAWRRRLAQYSIRFLRPDHRAERIKRLGLRVINGGLKRRVIRGDFKFKQNRRFEI